MFAIRLSEYEVMQVADSTEDRDATSDECYALSASTVGPSLFYTNSLRKSHCRRRRRG